MSFLVDTYQRYRTIWSHKIHALPIVILMPHSACNCRCVMCDIWQDNKNLKQLTVEDVSALVEALRQYKTQVVVMSGGEALLNRNFFKLCEILRKESISITLLSTGLTLKQHADQILEHISELIVSLDGSRQVHDEIRRIPNAFEKLREGVLHLKKLKPGFRITARSVIQSANFRDWPGIIDSAKSMGLNQVSFLPADVSSTAFNRPETWNDERQQQVQPFEKDLPAVKRVIEKLFSSHAQEFRSGFIAESPEKLMKIYLHYSAGYGLNPYPYKKCNAPWVSAVIEADGTVRHCFFLESSGNIREKALPDILNSDASIAFRKNLSTQLNPICEKCVCYLHLSPTTNF